MGGQRDGLANAIDRLEQAELAGVLNIRQSQTGLYICAVIRITASAPARLPRRRDLGAEALHIQGLVRLEHLLVQAGLAVRGRCLREHN